MLLLWQMATSNGLVDESLQREVQTKTLSTLNKLLKKMSYQLENYFLIN